MAGLKHIATVVTFTLALTALLQLAHAVQPADVISKEPEKYYVRQGAAQCGPAAFYIVMKYYGDHCKERPYYYDTGGRPLDLGSCGESGDTSTVTADSPVSAWIKGGESSTPWSGLLAGARGLYHKDEKGALVRYYEAVESFDSVTPMNDRGAESRRMNFLERMVPVFIDNNRPVIIHLKRRWPFPGHYIVIVGYDSANKQVLYMDPNGEKNSVVKTVSVDEFINSYWYRGNAPALWGRARWSGKWAGFYRTRHDAENFQPVKRGGSAETGGIR